jgi:penicillin-binding protein 1B
MVRRRLNQERGRIGLVTIVVVGLAAFGATCWMAAHHLGTEIRDRFDGRRWSLPAIVYARPLELYPGLTLSPQALEEELQLAGYRRDGKAEGAGSYAASGGTVRLVSRDFHYPSGVEAGRAMTVTFAGGTVATLSDGAGKALPLVRLDPVRIGSFHPLVHEDRLLVAASEIPPLLRDTLLAVEDRNFYDHFGIAPTSLVRALVANLRAGRTVQGGSTLTQQLVKNLFLSNERTFSRKAQEAIMALLLEGYADKEEILTTYVNEVFLGQDDNRAVHGFALASQFYFRRDLGDLRPDQVALLVGLVKGPTAYDPRRKPEECRQRRDLVLAIMRERGLIEEGGYREALTRAVNEVPVQKHGFNRFPAFLQLVRQQLAGEYKEEDLKNGGLRILTTLDPRLQTAAERHLQEKLLLFGTKHKDGGLEGAVVVTGRENGEVLALVGGKDPLLPGFNRALQAKRQIGSLVKPAVYLAALQRGYGLADPLDDSLLRLPTEGGKDWQPENYDRREHGSVPLYLALAHSYNLATVRLGLAIGLDQVVATLGALGYQGTIEAYPSLLLGAIEMTPLEVCQIYQTIAAGGFFTGLRAINSVMDSQGGLLNRYGLAVAQRIEPEPAFLLTHALQRVVSEGTAADLLSSPLRRHHIAGKTGTTDNLRDSWFAGFSGDHLGVVWIGRDDNGVTGLTGASGALRVWRAMMEEFATSPLQPVAPETIAWTTRETEGGTGGKAAPLPRIAANPARSGGTVAPPAAEPSLLDTIGRWFKVWQ